MPKWIARKTDWPMVIRKREAHVLASCSSLKRSLRILWRFFGASLAPLWCSYHHHALLLSNELVDSLLIACLDFLCFLTWKLIRTLKEIRKPFWVVTDHWSAWKCKSVLLKFHSKTRCNLAAKLLLLMNFLEQKNFLLWKIGTAASWAFFFEAELLLEDLLWILSFFMPTWLHSDRLMSNYSAFWHQSDLFWLVATLF